MATHNRTGLRGRHTLPLLPLNGRQPPVPPRPPMPEMHSSFATALDWSSLANELKSAGYDVRRDAVLFGPDPEMAETAHFDHVPSLSILLPGMACTHVVAILTHYLTTMALPTLWPSARMDVRAMRSYLDHCGLTDFPILMAHYGVRPEDTTLVLVHGQRRPDGLAVCFAPPRIAPPLLHPRPAHWVFISGVPIVMPEVEPLVYFGNVFLGPDFYWHASQPSQEYTVMASNNLACLCNDRCEHEGQRFANAPSFGFTIRPYTIKGCHYTATIDATLNPQYAHGPSDALYYRSPTGRLHIEPEAFDLLERRDGAVTSYRSITNANLTISMYARPNYYAPWYIFLGCISGLSLGVMPLILLSSLHGDFVDELHYLGIEHYLVAVPVLTTVIGLLVGLWVYYRTPIQPELSVVPSTSGFFRGAIPSTMRFGGTSVAQRLERIARSRHEWSRADLYATTRRVIAEDRYRCEINPYELQCWVERNSTVQASAPIPGIPVGHCVTCLARRKLHHCICASCRSAMVNVLYWCPIDPTLVAHVGMRPLYTRPPVIPLDRVQWRSRRNFPSFNGKEFGDLSELYHALIRYHPELPTCRGRLCGPMFMGLEPACYERGDWSSAIAAASRLLILPPCHFFEDGEDEPYGFEPQFAALFAVAEQLFPQLMVPLEPWTRSMVLDHQRVPAKKEAMIRSYAEMDEGMVLTPERLMKVKPFVKSEKDVRDEHGQCYLLVKPKRKAVPRCINPVHPHVIAICAPYSYPMSKLLNRVFNCGSNVLYASGSTPDEINIFLNRAIAVNRCVLEDDVSMADASHSRGSFEYQHNIMRRQWPYMDRYVWSVFEQMTIGRLSTGRFRAFVRYVNLSGVPLTSWTNTIVFIMVRLFAFAISFRLAENVDDVNVHHLRKMLPNLFMAVAGDDGKTFTPEHFNGVLFGDFAFLTRYSTTWADFGYPVEFSKIRAFFGHNWRLSTFLAMRPVWSGERYEYGVEIARRLKTMFWQIDNNMHPVAWARGICISLLAASRHVPIVNLICNWYLMNTNGSANDVEFTNPYSTFYGYKVQGDLNDRAIAEFCEDYGVTLGSLLDFKSMLENINDVLVNLSHPVLEAVYSKE